MRYSNTLILVMFAFLFTACGSGEQPQGQVEGGLGIPSGIYAIDKSHTYIVFSYFHQNLSYPLLRMTDIDGELELDGGKMDNSRANIAIAVDSIRTNLDYFDNELASRKFFYAEKYPHITFVTHSYKSLSDSLGELTGFVTIRNVIKPLVLTVTINGAMAQISILIGSYRQSRTRSKSGLKQNSSTEAAAQAQPQQNSQKRRWRM